MRPAPSEGPLPLLVFRMLPFQDASKTNRLFAVSEKVETSIPTDYLGCRPIVPKERATDDDVSRDLFTPESNPLEGGFPLVDTNSIPLPPNHAMLSATPSPFYEERHPDMSSIIGVRDVAFPTPPIAKAAINFRLPSFQMLGIAAPAPFDVFLNPNHSELPLNSGSPSPPGDSMYPVLVGKRTLARPLDFRPPNVGDPPPWAAPTSLSQNHIAVQQFVLTHTPPDEQGTINWGSTRGTTAEGMDSDAPTPTEETTPTGNIISQPSVSSTSMNLGLNSSPTGIPLYFGNMPWLGQALPAIRTSLILTCF
jgi:hypothetical protein